MVQDYLAGYMHKKAEELSDENTGGAADTLSKAYEHIMTDTGVGAGVGAGVGGLGGLVLVKLLAKNPSLAKYLLGGTAGAAAGAGVGAHVGNRVGSNLAQERAEAIAKLQEEVDAAEKKRREAREAYNRKNTPRIVKRRRALKKQIETHRDRSRQGKISPFEQAGADEWADREGYVIDAPEEKD